MKIKFYAHASFRLEGDGIAVVTDPYTPGPQVSNFEPIQTELETLFKSQNQSGDNGTTSIPATFLRVTVKC